MAEKQPKLELQEGQGLERTQEGFVSFKDNAIPRELDNEQEDGILDLPIPIKDRDIIVGILKRRYLHGSGSLVNGVLEVEHDYITANSIGFANLNTIDGTPGSQLEVVCTEGVATITSKVITGTAPGGGGGITVTGLATASADTSLINYLIVIPLWSV